MRVDDGRVVSQLPRARRCSASRITVYGDGSQTRSFCYVDDEVRGFLALLDGDITGPVNIGNPNEFTVRELAEMVLEVTGSSSEIVYEPLPVDDPTQRQPDITLARERARLGAARSTSARASSAPPPGSARPSPDRPGMASGHDLRPPGGDGRSVVAGHGLVAVGEVPVDGAAQALGEGHLGLEPEAAGRPGWGRPGGGAGRRAWTCPSGSRP